MKSKMSSLYQKTGVIKPFIIRTMVERPCCHLAVNWAAILLMAAVVIGADLIQVHDLQFNDFLILQEKDVKNFFAHEDAESVAADARSEGGVGFRTEASFALGAFHLYDNADLFSPKNIQAICETERVYVSGDSYPLFCQTEEANGLDTVCLPQLAAVSSYYYDFNLTECQLLDQVTIDAITAGLLANDQIGPLLFNDLDNPTVARSTLVSGTPLGDDTPPLFKNFSVPVSDFLEEEAQDGHSFFLAEYEANLFEFFGLSNDPPFNYVWNRAFFTTAEADVHIRIYSSLLDSAHIDEVLATDQVIISASFFSVLLVVVLYVKSFFLAFSALISITLTMIVSLFIYAAVLNINYFTTLHVVSFFIIIAIGANNFYVISDAWKQSEQVIQKEQDDSENEYLIKRLDYTYTRAALSVFNTAMTTFIAFLANLSSPISVIAGFGLFSGIAVFVNFIFMLNVHPTHIMIHHKYVRHWWFKKVKPTQEAENILEAEAAKKKQEVELVEEQEKKPTKFDVVRDAYISLVLYTPFPYVGVIVMFVLATVMISIALRLETPTTVETIYPDSYMWTGFIEEFNGAFSEGSDDTFTEVFGVFGISDLDTGNVKFLDSNQFRGDVVFDEDFDFSLEETQNKIIDYCELLPTIDCFASGCTIDKLVLERTILCSMQAFRDFHESQFGTDSFVTRTNGTATGLSLSELAESVELFLASDAGVEHASSIGLLDGEVKFVATSFRQSMNVDQPLVVKEPVLEVFDELQALVLLDAPVGTTTYFHTSFDIVWTYTEVGLVNGLFSGMIVSLGLSYFIILFGTRHLLVSAYAILGVAFIVSCVLGTVQTLGFELGVTEAIAGVMVIGLAVDYIVHLGYMFMAAKQRGISYAADGKEEKREKGEIKNVDMIRYSVEKMMFTILAGGFTTFAAGIVLFACTLSFFFKMGVLIMFTALYSVMFAFIFFIPMLKIFGPGKR